MTLYTANTRCYSDDKAYVLWFGEGYGEPTRVLAFGRSLDSAMSEIGDWLKTNAPGHLCDQEVAEAYQRAENEWREAHPDKEPGETEVWAFAEEAETDTTLFGDEHRVLSWCWGIDLDGDEPAELGRYVSELRKTGRL